MTTTLQEITFSSDQGSVWLFRGCDVETGDHVLFAVDHRPAFDLLQGITMDDVDMVDVEDWQIIHVEMCPSRLVGEHRGIGPDEVTR